MISRYSIVKNAEKILIVMQKISSENSLPLPRNRKKTEKISLRYDVNDHVYSTKSV